MRQNPPGPVSFTAAGMTQTSFLFGIPAKHIVVGVVAKLIVEFAATGLTASTVTIGTTSIPNNTITSANFFMPTFSCFQTFSPPNYPMMYWSPFAMLTTDPQDIKAVFTTTGANLADLTAGE